jgi:uncharacterized OsmC-like protein
MADFSDFADISCSINSGGGCSVGVAWDKNSGCEAYVRDFPPFGVDMPVQHGGAGMNPCPHELLLSAVGSCFIGTFLVFQRQLRLELVDMRAYVKGRLELGTKGENNGKYDFTGIDVYIKVTAKGDEYEKEIVGDCLRMTKNHCPTTRALAKAVPLNIISEIKMVAG